MQRRKLEESKDLMMFVATGQRPDNGRFGSCSETGRADRSSQLRYPTKTGGTQDEIKLVVGLGANSKRRLVGKKEGNNRPASRLVLLRKSNEDTRGSLKGMAV
jgi:hypothetical protein